MDNFFDLPVNKILKAERAYIKIYENRIIRLTQWSPVNTESQIEDFFDRAISLTEDCHKLSVSIKELIDNIVNESNRENVRIVEKVCANFDKAIIQQQNDNNLDKYFVDFTANIREIAKNVFLEILQNCSDSEKTIGVFLDEKLSSYDEIVKEGVKQHINLINYGFEQAKTKHQIDKGLFILIKLFRGLLYVGILETEGEKLDKRIFGDNLKRIKNEAIGVKLPIGLLKSLWKAFIDYYSYDVTNELIDNAVFLEKYLDSYLNLLKAWSNLITNFKKAIEKMNYK